MKNKLQIFHNVEFGDIRVIKINEEPWFVAKDISDYLNYSDATAMTRHLDDDEKENCQIDSMSKSQIVINESGLYSAILKSRKIEAKKFKKWVTSEVLPSLRKHGAYMTENTLEEALTNPDFLIKLATELKEEQRKRRELEFDNKNLMIRNTVQGDVIKAQTPKVIFADAVSASHTSILVGDLAKILKQNGIDTGQNRLFDWMRDNGFLIKRKGCDYNMPTQRSMEMGLFEIKEGSRVHSDGHISITKTTKVTGKGQIYFINKLKPALALTEV